MLALAIGKILKNKWLFLCLFMACVFSVALFVSIPVYGTAVKRHVIYKELSARYAQSGSPPMIFTFNASQNQITNRGDGSLEGFGQYVRDDLAEGIGLPILSESLTLAGGAPQEYRLAADITGGSGSRIKLLHMSGLFEKIELTAGRLPENGLVDGAYEVIVSEETAWSMRIMQDSLYQLFRRNSGKKNEETVPFRVVGVFRESDNERFWLDIPRESAYVTEETFIALAETASQHLDFRFDATWNFVLDHTALTMDILPSVLKARWQGATVSNRDVLTDL